MSEEAEDLDLLFDAVANRHRRAMVQLLALGPQSISRLAEARRLSLPAINKHIRILAEAGIVRRRKLGRTTFLALDRASIRRLQAWTEQYHAYWGTDEETLENYEPYLAADRPTERGTR